LDLDFSLGSGTAALPDRWLYTRHLGYTWMIGFSENVLEKLLAQISGSDRISSTGYTVML